jgi:hypothetical protein
VYHDGSNSARVRNARIRSAHEYEATELDSMQRRAVASLAPARRISLVAVAGRLFGRIAQREAPGVVELRADPDGSPIATDLAD